MSKYDFPISFHISEVLKERIFVGDAYTAKSKDLLEKFKIDIIVNCAVEVNYEKFKEFTYFDIKVHDDMKEDISKHFQKFFDFVESNKKKRILVHCASGISRSVTMVISYIMKYKKMTYLEARQFVQIKRNCSYPNVNFQRQLKEYELELNKESKKTVLITGSNRGIGLGLVELLHSKNSKKYKIIGTYRNKNEMDIVLEKLKKKGIEIDSHLLDISDDNSINNLYKYVKDKYGTINYLVNNAGVQGKLEKVTEGKDNKITKFYEPITVENAKLNMNVNYYGTKKMSLKFMDIVSHKIINVSSGSGNIYNSFTTDLKKKYKELNSITALDNLMNEFVQSVSCKSYEKLGYSTFNLLCYGVSKWGVIIMSNIIPKIMKKDIKDIKIVSVCPGWARTRIGGDMTIRTPKRASEHIKWLLENEISNDDNGLFFGGRGKKYKIF